MTAEAPGPLRLEVSGLTRTVPGAGTILRPTELRLHAGEILMVRGRSGSGKTTLLNLIAGLDRPDGGRVVHHPDPPGDPVEVSALREPALTRHRRDHVGIVFQQFNLVSTLSVTENVLLPLALTGRGRDPRARAAAVERLRRLGLGARLDAFPETLSGGEQQRVAIARALAHGPGLLLADEPTGSLDPGTGDRVFELLLEEVRDSRTALLMVTHSDALAARGDRTLDLERDARAAAPAADR